MKDDTPLVDEDGRNSLDPKHAPVSLPPGSFDIDDLKAGLEKAVKAKKPEDRDGLVQDAILAAAAEGTDLSARDPSAMVGFRMVEVESKIGDTVVKERTQVFDPELAAEAEAKAAEVAVQANPPVVPATSPARGAGSQE